MSKTVQFKRGNANVSATYVGAQGEITVNTDNYTLNVHDGVRAGGYTILNANVSNIGNLSVTNQTIIGTSANTNITLSPNNANVVLTSNLVTPNIAINRYTIQSVNSGSSLTLPAETDAANVDLTNTFSNIRFTTYDPLTNAPYTLVLNNDSDVIFPGYIKSNLGSAEIQFAGGQGLLMYANFDTGSTGISLNDTGTSDIFANVDLRLTTNYSGAGKQWLFGSNGTLSTTGNLSTANLSISHAVANNTVQVRTLANSDLKLVATDGIAQSAIYLWANNQRMSFNTVSNAFDFNFNGQLSATDFTASKNSAYGYSFYAAGGGYSGMRHTSGPPDYISIEHEGNIFAKFISNATVDIFGNLVVSADGQSFGSFPTAFVQVYANVDTYSQMVLQNINDGTSASTDVVVTADNGDDASYYINMGILGSNHAAPEFFGDTKNYDDGYLIVVGNDSTGGAANVGNLILGSTNGIVKTFVGNIAEANVVTTVSESLLTVAGNIIPAANVTYGLGTETNQWKDLWLSNTTLYMGGTAITVVDGTLSVGGNVVGGNNYNDSNVISLLASFGSNSIVTTGLISGNLRTQEQTIALGYNTGNTNQGTAATAVGYRAGETNQGLQAVAIGSLAGLTSQGNGATALGSVAGSFNQSQYAVAVGALSGGSSQGQYSVAVGYEAGKLSQGDYSVAIGKGAGANSLPASSIVINGTGSNLSPTTSGFFVAPIAANTTGNVLYYDTITKELTYGAAGSVSSLSNGNSNVQIPTANGNVTVTSAGSNTWTFDQFGSLNLPGGTAYLYSLSNQVYLNADSTSYNSIDIITNGDTVLRNQRNVTIISDSIGSVHTWTFGNTGELTAPGNIIAQNIRTIDGTVHVGQGAGLSNQGTYGIAVGRFAGSQTQGGAAVAIGQLAGQISQGSTAVAIGFYAAANTQSANSVSIGTYAGQISQGAESIAIGRLSGNSSQGAAAVSMGRAAGRDNQGIESISIGADAGQTNQGAYSIAIGSTTAYLNQGTGAVAIGASAGAVNQGNSAVAIGAGAGSGQVDNSIVINANGSTLTAANAGLYIDPIRNDTSSNSKIVTYNTSTKELTYTDTISVTGNISAANLNANVNGFSIGYRDVPQVIFTSNATLALTDAGKHYYSSNSANIITVPNNATVSFNIGAAISIVQQGTANLTITPGSGVTMYLAGNATSSSRLLGNYGMATLMKVDTDTWFINGTGLT